MTFTWSVAVVFFGLFYIYINDLNDTILVIAHRACTVFKYTYSLFHFAGYSATIENKMCYIICTEQSVFISVYQLSEVKKSFCAVIQSITDMSSE